MRCGSHWPPCLTIERHPKMEIQDYAPAFARQIADLFYRAVHAVDPGIYTPEQQEAWAPTPPDYDAWIQRLAQKRPWLALIEGRLAGFIELDPDGHIDCLYVDPDFQKRGVAGTLYTHLEETARRQKMKRLYVEASLLARPFFEKRGFRRIESDRIHRNGEVLINFKMEKAL